MRFLPFASVLFRCDRRRGRRSAGVCLHANEGVFNITAFGRSGVWTPDCFLYKFLFLLPPFFPPFSSLCSSPRPPPSSSFLLPAPLLGQPTSQPDNQPASQPNSQPASQPTNHPNSQPSTQPLESSPLRPAAIASLSVCWLPVCLSVPLSLSATSALDKSGAK